METDASKIRFKNIVINSSRFSSPSVCLKAGSTVTDKYYVAFFVWRLNGKRCLNQSFLGPFLN